RVAIVDDADDLSEEASNAFLKTLEEPPAGSVLVLICTSAELQLETIVSRCRVVRFDPLPDPVLAQILREQGIAEGEDESERLAFLAEGSVSRAIGLADPALGEFRRELIDLVAAPAAFDPPLLARRIEEFSKDAGKEGALQRGRARLVV